MNNESDRDKTMDEVKLAELIGRMIDDKFGHLLIEPGIHHRDHLIVGDITSEDIVFLRNLRECLADLKTTSWRALIRIVIPGIVILIIAGVVSYFKLHKGH